MKWSSPGRLHSGVHLPAVGFNDVFCDGQTQPHTMRIVGFIEPVENVGQIQPGQCRGRCPLRRPGRSGLGLLAFLLIEMAASESERIKLIRTGPSRGV